VRAAEPARFATDLHRAIAGEPPSAGRRLLASIVLTLLGMLSVPVVLVLWLALAVLVGRIGATIAPPLPVAWTVMSWVPVALTTVTVVGVALAVSWVSRGRAGEGTREALPEPGGDEPAEEQGGRTDG
jgi:hypothetical protein